MIVVGAGPAGVTAAYLLAKAGLNVVVFERGEYPGSKNTFGGILYSTVLNKLIPKFWEEAPVERYVTSRTLMLLSPRNAVKVTIQSEDYAQEPYNNSWTTIRPRFDLWYASKAEEAGALIINETVVDDLIWKDGQVVGVRARREEGELYADVVLAADGVNSFLAKKAGLRKDFTLEQLGLGVQELIALPRRVIEDRFNLEGDRGAVIECVGDACRGMWGVGFLYTMRESISIGIGTTLKVLVERRIKPQDLLEHFKNHPFIKGLIRGGELKEYLAHMTPEGGYDYLPKLYTNGMLLLGDAAGLLNASPHYEGSNLAMASGMFAAETVLRAKEKGDFSERTLSYYKYLLDNSFVMKDMKRSRKFFRFLQNNEEFFGDYLNLFTELAVDYYTINDLPKAEQEEMMVKKLFKRLPILKFSWQLLKMASAYFESISNLARLILKGAFG